MNRPSSELAPIDGPDGCPEPDALAQYVEGLLGGRRRFALDAHLPVCDRCRSLVAALARAGLVAEGAVAAAHEDTLRTLPRLPRWIPFVAAASILAALLAFAFPSRAPGSPDTDARLVAVAARLATERPDLFAGFRPLNGRERTAGELEVQRGGVELMSPSGVTVETRPTFEWADIDGASGYSVVIIDAEGARVLATKTKSARLDGTALEQPLKRGGNYVWKVTAVGPPTPAEGTCALRIADDAAARLGAAIVATVAAATDEALRDLATAHALLRRGLAADALPFARRFAASHPDDVVGRETLLFVRRQLSLAAKRP
jgi:hypothetical protein